MYTPNIPTNYLQSLRECVQRLQDSSVKVYELVTEAEIREAQSSLAVQLEPRVNNLLLKAEDMLKELEKRENMLQEEADRREHELDAELKKAQLDSLQYSTRKNVHAKSSARQSGQTRQQNQEQAKRLKEVKKKVERMAKVVAQLEEEYNQKEMELQLQKQRVATEKRPSAIKAPKKSMRKKSLSSSALAAVEEQIRDIDILIGEKREILDEQQSLSLEVLQAAETPLDEDLKWNQYQTQSEFFKHILQQIASNFNWPSDAVLDFEMACNSYSDSLDNVHFEATSSLQKNMHKGVENMKILAKLFYPTDNIGVTVAVLVENLLQAEQNEKYIKELRKEFPPEQERLHRLQTAITLLNRLEIAEIRD
ncbi:8351_t:CDS:2, partial [Cetraspora pellucida]